MRAMMKQANLAGYAGQFVWLELNFDKAENHAFLVRYGAISTPTFYVINPHDGKVAASQSGAMSLSELKQFLDRGANVVREKTQTPWDEALIKGDALLAREPEKAVEDYRQVLKMAPEKWPRRELAQSSLVTALQNSGQYQQCAETAASEAAGMGRDAMFARTLVGGMWCLVTPDPAPWTDAAAQKLEPLAKEALSLSTTVRDHRDELYRTLMYLSLSRNDKAKAAEWGDRWLKELDAIKPMNDEQRSAVDIARVEEVQTFGDPNRILPELIASERAMPDNWNASLRVAQMESAAENYDDALAACDRGLARVAGPAGRAWILRVKADALMGNNQREAARDALEEALVAAEQIPNPQTRDNNVKTIKAALERDHKDEKR
jgi:tetratricopeptide (TPR) repeat protein